MSDFKLGDTVVITSRKVDGGSFYGKIAQIVEINNDSPYPYKVRPINSDGKLGPTSLWHEGELI